jgi:molecular chaperone Hsp33
MADQLVNFASEETKIRAVYVDATDSARELSQRHLVGPAASYVLGEASTAVSLLSSDMSQDDECITLRLDVDGPVEGYLVEATAGGNLRGYTRTKVINALDAEPIVTSDPILGSHGHAQVVRSLPTTVLSTANLRIDAPCTRVAVARYFNHSMQTPTGVSLLTQVDETAVTVARGLTVERMPDGDKEVFIRVLEALTAHESHPLLSSEDPVADFGATFGIPDLLPRESRSLQFACRCSHEKAVSAIGALQPNEQRHMIDSGKGTTIYCHMCGRGFAISVDEIKALITHSGD